MNSDGRPHSELKKIPDVSPISGHFQTGAGQLLGWDIDVLIGTVEHLELGLQPPFKVR